MWASEKIRSIELRTCKLTPIVSVPFLLIVEKKIQKEKLKERRACWGSQFKDRVYCGREGANVRWCPKYCL